MKRYTAIRRARMTLVEIIVAMSILMVIMWVVMRTFQSTQAIWRTSQETTHVYEQARLVLDFMSRDLRGMVVSNNPGSVIPYTASSTDLPGSSVPALADMPGVTSDQLGTRKWLVAFVSNSGVGTTSTDKDVMSEVGYFIHVRKAGMDGSTQLYDTELWRAMTPYGVGNWDFLTNTNWAKTWDNNYYALIADGIANIAVQGAYYSTATGGLRTIDTIDATNPVLPRYIRIRLAMQTAVDRQGDTRLFSKTVYFPGAP